MVKAGDKTLESYRYAPNNGPLITIAYGNGDTQEILYDKEERIKSRRWNGESTDAVRYEYDDYGTLEKEIDPANGRIDKDQYDMTGRLVQSVTLEKKTSHGDRDGGSKCVTTGSICVPKNIMILKSLKVQEKSFQAFFVFIRIQQSRRKNKSSQT